MVQEYWPTPHTSCIGQKEATVTATATKTMTSTMTKLLATCGLHVATSCCDSLRQNQLQRHSSDCSHWRPRNDSEWRCQRHWTNTLTTKKSSLPSLIQSQTLFSEHVCGTAWNRPGEDVTSWSVSVCQTDLMVVGRSPDLFADRFFSFLSASVFPTCSRLG